MIVGNISTPSVNILPTADRTYFDTVVYQCSISSDTMNTVSGSGRGLCKFNINQNWQANEPFGLYEHYYITGTQYIFCTEAFSWTSNWYSDDQSWIHLNGSLIYFVSGCTTTSITINFVRGWNILNICWHEGSGTSCGYFSTDYSTDSRILYCGPYVSPSQPRITTYFN